jgi:hypothetical protein
MSMTATPSALAASDAGATHDDSATPSHIAAEVMARLAAGVLAISDHAFEANDAGAEAQGDDELEAWDDLDAELETAAAAHDGRAQ